MYAGGVSPLVRSRRWQVRQKATFTRPSRNGHSTTPSELTAMRSRETTAGSLRPGDPDRKGRMTRRGGPNVSRPGAAGPHPREELVAAEVIEDLLALQPREYRGADPDPHHVELARRVRVGTDRDPAAGLGGEPEELDVQVLAVGIRVDLERLVQLGRSLDDATPVRAQARAEVPDAPTRMRVHVDRAIRERFQVALGLVVLLAKLAVERTEHEIALGQEALVHVTGPLRRHVHRDSAT